MSQFYEWTSSGERSLDSLLAALEARRAEGATIVTTNGCFDVLHAGHVAFLEAAHAQGDLLVVGLNGDESVRQLKGAGRPIVPEHARAALLAALRAVDHVVVFDAPTPNELLARIRPDIHCKAGDYSAETLPETSIVRAGGGEVRILPLVEGFSTSRLVAKVLEQAQGGASAAPASGRGAGEIMLDDANLLRQTGYALGSQLGELAATVRAALDRGNMITVFGNRSSAALTAAAGLDYSIYLPPGRAGDIMLVVMPDPTPPDLSGVVEAARERGITAVALLNNAPSPLAELADMCLRVPTDDPNRARLAMVAALRVLRELVQQQ